MKIQPTLETLHQWLQIIGKLKLRTVPWQNHSWHSALYISSRGITTGSIPWSGRTYQIDLDFIHHELHISCSDGRTNQMKLEPMTVASFYAELFKRLKELDIDVKIHGRPNEMEPAIPFDQNETNRDYDTEAVTYIWKSLECANAVFNEFRSGFLGKSSPVHLFWGGFDLTVSRYSGREAPLHPGGMPNMPLDVMQEAYSHEVASVGFWFGSKDFPIPVFYSYIYPTPESFGSSNIRPEEAFFSDEMGEFLLKYSDVSNAQNPAAKLLEFLESTYNAAASTAQWNRGFLDKGE